MSQPSVGRIEDQDVTRREFYKALGIFMVSLPRGEWCGPLRPEETGRFVPVVEDDVFRRNLELFTRDFCKVSPVLADIPIEVACMSKPWGWRPPGCPDDRYRYF